MPAIDLTELFTRLGRDVYWSNQILNEQYTLLLGPAGESINLQSEYLDRLDLVQGFTTLIIQQANTMAGWISSGPINVANNTLADLQLDLNAPSTTPGTILPLLYEYMVENSATIQSTIINAPVITPDAGNNGNGVVLVSTMNALGITDERIIDEVVKLTCTQSQWSGGTAGAERFSIVGWPELPSPDNYGIPGNGNGGSMQVSDSTSPNLDNGDFESWSGSPLTPTGWTRSAGLVTNVIRSAVSHSGTYACALTGDGSQATITLTQNIQATFSTASLTVFCAAVWLRKSGTVNAGSTLTISITGTGVSTETLVSLDPNTLTTSYALYHLFFSTSRITPPTDWTFNISWTAANVAGASAVILVDDANLVFPQEFGHCQIVIFRGEEDFAVGDFINYETSIYSSGVFQSWFSRWYDTQLPSSASPSISDALCG